jgi:AraC family transcriptional regulator
MIDTRATFAAHRRQLVRQMLRGAGVETDDGDPINWLRARRGETGETGETEGTDE